MSALLRPLGLLAANLVVLAVFIFGPPSRASRDMVAESSHAAARLEVVVFETASCTYCEIFRRDVAPRYRFAPVSSQAPLRFVDISRVDTEKLGLVQRLDVLPTTVLMKGGREIERIAGLTHPDTFVRVLQHYIAKIE